MNKNTNKTKNNNKKNKNSKIIPLLDVQTTYSTSNKYEKLFLISPRNLFLSSVIRYYHQSIDSLDDWPLRHYAIALTKIRSTFDPLLAKTLSKVYTLDLSKKRFNIFS